MSEAREVQVLVLGAVPPCETFHPGVAPQCTSMKLLLALDEFPSKPTKKLKFIAKSKVKLEKIHTSLKLLLKHVKTVLKSWSLPSFQLPPTSPWSLPRAPVPNRCWRSVPPSSRRRRRLPRPNSPPLQLRLRSPESCSLRQKKPKMLKPHSNPFKKY